jgi:hypothetical protein
MRIRGGRPRCIRRQIEDGHGCVWNYGSGGISNGPANCADAGLIFGNCDLYHRKETIRKQKRKNKQGKHKSTASCARFRKGIKVDRRVVSE